jgi:hypothetical protein
MRCVRSIEGHVELEKMKALMPGTYIHHISNFFTSFSTCAQLVAPRIQTRVPLPTSCASGTTHLISWTLGHGQSTGFATHTSVSWQRYWEQGTFIDTRENLINGR